VRINTQAMQPATANPITFFFLHGFMGDYYYGRKRREGRRRRNCRNPKPGRIRFTERWGFWFLVSS
jgi:hypothetical protein